MAQPDTLEASLGWQSARALLDEAAATEDAARSTMADRAFEMLEEQLAEFQPQLPDTSQRLIALHTELAWSYYRWQAYAEARRHFVAAAALWHQRVPGGTSESRELTYYAGVQSSYLDEERKALHFGQTIEQRLQALTTPSHADSSLLIRVYNLLGVVYQELDRYDSAQVYLLKSLDLRKRFYGPDHRSTGLAYFSLATQMQELYKLDSAEAYYQQALAIFLLDSANEKILQNLAQTYNNLGLLAESRLNYVAAAEYLRRVVSIRRRTHDHFGLAGTLMNLGRTYTLQGLWQAADSLFRDADPFIRQCCSDTSLVMARLKYNIAEMLYLQRQYQACLDTLATAELILAQYPDNFYELAASYSLKADALGHLQKVDAALSAYRMADSLYVQTFGPETIYRTTVQNHIANLYLTLKQYDLALQHHRLALDYLGFSMQKPDLYPFGGTLQDLIDALTARVGIFSELLVLEQNPAYLDSVLESLDIALLAMQEMGERFQDPSSLVFLWEEMYDLFELGIEALLPNEAVSADNIERAFELAERGKTAVLRRVAALSQADRYAGLPAHLRAQEQRFQTRLANLSQSLESLVPGTAAYTDSLSQWQLVGNAYRDFQSQLEADYPRYHQLRHDWSVVSLGDLQESLSADQATVEYVLGSEHIFVFVITSEASRVRLLPRHDSLEAAIRAFRQAIEDPYGPPQTYHRLGHQLYQWLWAPLAELDLPARIQIVPDGALAYLPFEALLTQPAQPDQTWRTLSYLIDQHRISYQYSATIGHYLTKQSLPHGTAWLGVAPEYHPVPDGLTLSPLPSALEEIEKLRQLMSGDLHRGESAFRAISLPQWSQYQIIHFSGHALADETLGDRAFLACSNRMEDRLTAGDIYDLNLPTRLIVLSACETGIGPFYKGEGVISLERAFTYAGAKRVLSTLWTVPEAASKQLMLAFYDQMVQGKSTDEALYQAKIDLIERGRQITPYHWASFRLVGDPRPLKTSWGWWPWLLGLGILALAGLWRLSRRATQR